MNTFSTLIAVFYKELIKTRFIMFMIVLFNIAYMVWNFIELRRLFLMDHSEVVWFRVINLEQIPYENLMFIPLISAIFFCCFQFLQEMRDARIRISLHTPCNSSDMVLFHALFGIAFLLGIFTLDMVILSFQISLYFPYEVVIATIITTIPWFLAGIIAYLGGAFVLLEPQIKRKILGFLVSFITCVLLFMYTSIGFYTDIFCYFLLLLPCVFYTIALSADDYRNRWTS